MNITPLVLTTVLVVLGEHKMRTKDIK
jgi:hypothetical protein